MHALEQEDRVGELLPLDARGAATAAAAASIGHGRAGASRELRLAAKRARRLISRLEADYPALWRWLRWTRPGHGLPLPLMILALVLGLATNALGPERQVNVLALPLLGLVAWNLVMVLLALVVRWLPLLPVANRSAPPRTLAVVQSLGRALAGRLARRWVGDELAARRSGTGAGAQTGSTDGRQQRLAAALRNYLNTFLRASAPLSAARLRCLMHLAALVLVAGAVAGMYLRGTVFQYRAAWESTFLSGAAVDRVLGTVLGPAAAVLGTEVPSAAALERGAGLSPSAAPWIHLYAVTALLFVGVPRLGLALMEGLSALRLRGRVAVDLPAGYLQRLAAAGGRSAQKVAILPYSVKPPARAVETLKELLVDHLGPRADLELLPLLAYGEELAKEGESAEPAAADGPQASSAVTVAEADLVVLLFGLQQTPEAEVHGELVAGLAEAARLNGGSLLLVVEGGEYRRRLGLPQPDPRTADEDGASGEAGDSSGRIASRCKTWDRVLAERGPKALHLDLGAALPASALRDLTDALWPPREAT